MPGQMMGFGNLIPVIDQLMRYGDGMKLGALRGAAKEAEEIAAKSRDVYTPIDTGALRSTFRVTADLTNPEIAEVEIRVGGADSAAPYGVFVHENLSAFHQPPTQAKFLQRAVDEAVPGMSVRVGEEAVAVAIEKAR